MMVDCDCGEIPVVDSLSTMRPIGAVTDRDITCRAVAQGKNPLTMTAQECMTSPCITIHQDAGIEDCCRLMEEYKIRRVPVVDEWGRCCGIVAQADIAQAVDEVAAEVLKQVSRPAAGRAEERQ
jgi:CBS domain-containing protein